MTDVAIAGGIWPIVYAFFTADDRLDRAAMRAQTEAIVAGGAAGIAALGLATEVAKLTADERRSVMHGLIEDVAGRLPVAITVYGEDVAEQVSFASEAATAGAAWVILQPPPRRPLDESALLRHFGSVADRVAIPVAIQNAPQYLGVGLSDSSLLALCRNHPNVALLKAEAGALDVARTIERLGPVVRVFNGRGGLELPDMHRSGCAGLIPAPECFDVQVRIWRAMHENRIDEAEALYREILPLITFVMQSIPQFLCYGKRVAARRLGFEVVHDRHPALEPEPLGLAIVERWSRHLAPFGGVCAERNAYSGT